MVMSGDEEFATLFHPSHLALSRGTIVVFTDSLSLRLDNANHLAEHFNRFGWATLLVVMELPLLQNSNSENDTSTIEASSFAPYQSHLTYSVDKEKLNEAMTTLLPTVLGLPSLPRGYKLLLAQGMLAAQLMQLSTLEGIDGIVGVNAFWPDAASNQRLASDLAAVAAPLLDLALSHSNQWQRATQKNRYTEAMRKHKTQYRQRVLTTIDDIHAIPIIGTEVLDWIRAQGW